MRYARDDDTIVAPVTPPGHSGVGIVRLSGEKALLILEHLARREGAAFSPRHATVAGIFDPGDDSTIDQVLVVFYPSPDSYTGEDVVEISTHGNPVIMSSICDHAVRFGARLALPGEFTKRAFMKGKMDLSQAEAVQELIAARTALAAKAAQKRLGGGLGDLVRDIRTLLIDSLVHLEAAVDFPEEELEIVSEAGLEEMLVRALSRIEELLATFRAGRVLAEGANIALVGKPNAGKSSLLNRFLKEERAIVSPHPGTTRDFITETFHIQGVPIKLIDTAGIRAEQADGIESEGVSRSRRIIEAADLILFVTDGSEAPTAEDEVTKDAVIGKRYVLVMNKKDLGIASDFNLLREGKGFCGAVAVSAKTGEDMEMLEGLISRAIIGDVDSPSMEVLVGNLRQKEGLEKAKGFIGEAIRGCRVQLSPELIALEVRDGASSLGEVIGEITTEDILEEIFSSFCVGK